MGIIQKLSSIQYTVLQKQGIHQSKRDLEKYLGKLGAAVVDASLKFSVNYASNNICLPMD